MFVGGLDFGLTEGDVLAVFSQYGEIVDLHMVRDKTTGKPRGFAFLAYEVRGQVWCSSPRGQ